MRDPDRAPEPERVPVRGDADADAGAAARAAAVLRAGGVALLPAEGLYGYHALATSAPAIARLEALKPRGEGKGWIGLIARPADGYRWMASIPAAALSLIRDHWPGPLTIVLPAGPSVPAALRGPGETVALRCPGSAFLRAVVLGTNGLVVSTSANPPGAGAPSQLPPPEEIPPGVALIADQGPLSGDPSTVIRVEGERVLVLREGAARVSGTRLDDASERA